MVIVLKVTNPEPPRAARYCMVEKVSWKIRPIVDIPFSFGGEYKLKSAGKLQSHSRNRSIWGTNLILSEISSIISII